MTPADTPQDLGLNFPTPGTPQNINPDVPANNIRGLNPTELTDPNAIKIRIQNDRVPIVVLFGPPTCGKTMSMIRLARYLIKNGYTVTPVRSFRPSEDAHYRFLCDNLREMISSSEAQGGTDHISFMLLEISKNGHPLCQILEAPGEHYFSLGGTNQSPSYLNTISSARNRKAWLFFVEPDGIPYALNSEDRQRYVDKIKEFKATHTSRRDNFVIVYNKVDLSNFQIGRDAVNTSSAIENVRQSYPGLLEEFRNENPITKAWKSYNCDFVAFTCGFFPPLETGGQAYQEGHDSFPRRLWESIQKSIKG